MELQQTTTQPVNDAQIDASPSGGRMMESLIPQQGDQPCSTCGSQARSGANGTFTPSFVYALGQNRATLSNHRRGEGIRSSDRSS